MFSEGGDAFFFAEWKLKFDCKLSGRYASVPGCRVVSSACICACDHWLSALLELMLIQPMQTPPPPQIPTLHLWQRGETFGYELENALPVKTFNVDAHPAPLVKLLNQQKPKT